MSDRFTDHEHGIPASGVPYWPTWDGDPRRGLMAYAAYRPGGMSLQARSAATGGSAGSGAAGSGAAKSAAAPIELFSAVAVGRPAVLAVADGFLVCAPVLDSDGWSVRGFRVDPAGQVQGAWRLVAEAGPDILIESVRLGASGAVPPAPPAPAAGSTEEALLFRAPAELHAARPAVHGGPGGPVAVYDAWRHAGAARRAGGRRAVS